MKDTLIRVQHLHFSHEKSRPLLESINLDLLPGERLGLCGANGSGKSSLLHLLLGLERADSGAIHLLGRKCTEEVDFRPLRGQIGLMFQEPDDQLFCPTVEEDVAFGPLNLGYKHRQVHALVGEVLDELRLTHLASRPIHHLSGGEKRMVALAGLLVMQPKVLLLDEPTSGLDADAQALVTHALLSLPQAMIVVSHDAGFLRRVTTRRLALRDGVLTTGGDASQGLTPGDCDYRVLPTF